MRKAAFTLACAVGLAASSFVAASAFAQAQCDAAKGETPWTSEPLNAAECTCAEIPTLLNALASAKTYRDLFEKMASDLRAQERTGMTPAASRAEFSWRNSAGTAAVQRSEGASGDFATTDGEKCYTCIPVQTLGTKCRALLQAAWMHERVHTQVCDNRRKAGTGPYTVPGSDHAIEERDAYAANIPVLIAEIERLLKKLTITWNTKGADYSENGQVNLDRTVGPVSEDQITVGGQGSVTYDFRTFDSFRNAVPGLPATCTVKSGLPAKVSVIARLDAHITTPPTPTLLNLHSAGNLTPITAECPSVISRPAPRAVPLSGGGLLF